MRIVSGKFKGKQFFPPKAIKARPTTDFAKESLFNLLNNKISIEDISVLDLFTGTGNISYEFMSRGAKDCVCVDTSYHSFKFLKSMSKELDINIKAIKSDVFKFINQTPQRQFDVIFADPPYDLDNIRDIAPAILSKDWLKEDGLLIIEHGEFTSLSDLSNFIETKKYGKVHFSFFNA